MQVLIVDQEEVPGLLPMAECMEAMSRVLATLARGEALLPLRSILWLPEKVGGLGLMPAALLPEHVVGLKAITFFPGNEGTELDTHQGAVLLFEAERGRLLAVIDATSITAIRTAAVSGVATRVLAREDAGDLAIIGSGTQARSHLEAMAVARRLRRVRVASKDFDRARAFAARESGRHGVEVEPVRSAREAVGGADLICTTTSSREPVVFGEWISPGAHVNAVGSSVPFARELDTPALVRSRFYVDRRESALNEAGDFLIPKKEGAIGDGHILGELGEVLIGKVPGRRKKEEVTLFKSLGIAVEDVASARHIYEKAKSSGAGRWLDFGGARRPGESS
jgi:ornithine cyclodeaminase/alanine dehydrogenase-like protein (mu-crystallin family)